MTNRTQPTLRRAFTLIELLLVMVILVVLASVVTVQITQYRDKANLAKTKTDLHQLGTALTAFQIDCGQFPKDEEGLNALANDPGMSNWNGPYINVVPTDGWGSPYIYHAPGEHLPKSFDLYSAGPDKREGNEDDIANWQQG